MSRPLAYCSCICPSISISVKSLCQRMIKLHAMPTSVYMYVQICMVYFWL
jgi:hypothetical protein